MGSKALAQRRGHQGLARASRSLTLAMAMAVACLPGLPYVAQRWGPRSEPAPRAALPSASPAAAVRTSRAEGPIEMVRTRPLAAPTAQPEASPTAAERAAVEAAIAQQRAGLFKAGKRAVEPSPATPPAQGSAPPAAAGTSQPPAAGPEQWSEAEVQTALKTCVQILGPVAASVETLAPIRQDKCGTPAPVSLKRVGAGAQAVELSPPAVLNCAMVARIGGWVEKVLQPAAREAFGASVVRMNGTSGYVCRGRNGDTLPSGKISEHALANALDVTSFTLSDGRIVDVGKHWGPTRRDQGRPVPDAPEVQAPAAGAPPPPAQAPRPQRGAAHAAPAPQPAKGPAPPEAMAKEAQFLRHLHQGACSMFGTVLGPEANEAHREHFHLDLHPRKQSSYCQ
ncbi:MAG: extensin family protein [Hyphomicrobiaceae bacterium]|nr:extensin family protein [Hyphomicrobiaceae bacterium]